MRRSMIGAFVFSAIVSGVAARSSAALADYSQNYPAFMCTNTSAEVSKVTINASNQMSNANNSSAQLACPLITNDTLPTVNSAGIWFYSNGNNYASYFGEDSVEVSLCNISPAGFGGACGHVQHYSNGAGVSSLTGIDTSSYSVGDFNYLLVDLGGSTTSSYTTLFGYGISLTGS